MCLPVLLVVLLSASGYLGDECHLTPVIHVLQYPGCMYSLCTHQILIMYSGIPKPIPSFACTGRCTSYVQVRHEGGGEDLKFSKEIGRISNYCLRTNYHLILR